MTKAEVTKRIEKIQSVLNEMRESLKEHPVTKSVSVEEREPEYSVPVNAHDTGI